MANIYDIDPSQIASVQAPTPTNVSDLDPSQIASVAPPRPDDRSAYDKKMDEMPLAAQAMDPKAINAGASQIGRGVPVLGPATVQAGHAFASLLNQITPDALLKPEFRGKSVGEVYDMLQKQDADSQAQLRQDYPKAAVAGSAAGMAAMPIPGGGMGGAAGVAARLGGMGAMGYADTRERGGSIGDAVQSGLINAATAGAGELVGPIASKAMARKAEDVAFNSTGAMKADLREALERSGGDLSRLDETKRQVGREMLDQGALKPFSGRESTAQRIQQKLDQTGDNIGALIQKTDNDPAFAGWLENTQKQHAELQRALENPNLSEHQADQIHAYLNDVEEILSQFSFDRRTAAQSLRDVAGKYDKLPDYTTARRNLLRQADQLDSMPRFATLDEGNALKSSYGKATGNLAEDNFTKDLRKQAYDALRAQQEQVLGNRAGLSPALPNMDDPAVFQAASDSAVGQLKGLNKTYSNLKMAEQPSVNRDLSRQSNLGIGLRETGMGSIGATVGGAIGGPVGAVVGGATGIAASKFAKDVGPQTMAWGLDRLAKTSAKYGPILQAAAQRGGQALAVAHYLLSQQDPGYARESGAEGGSSSEYPRQVKHGKTGATATVSNDAEYQEARSEGFE